MSLIGVVPTALVSGCAAVVNSQARPGSRLKASLAAAGVALVLTVPLTLVAGVTGAAAVAYVISPIVEFIVLASQAGARLAYLGFRIARIGVPLAAMSVLLGHLTTSRATFAAAVVPGWRRGACRARNDRTPTPAEPVAPGSPATLTLVAWPAYVALVYARSDCSRISPRTLHARSSFESCQRRPSPRCSAFQRVRCSSCGVRPFAESISAWRTGRRIIGQSTVPSPNRPRPRALKVSLE